MNTPPPPPGRFLPLKLGNITLHSLTVQSGEGAQRERGPGSLVAHCKCSLEFVANKVKWQTGCYEIPHTHARREESKREARGHKCKKSQQGSRTTTTATMVATATARAEKIGNLTFDVFYETCSNNILGNLF